ncbi:CBS domain-containing protein [Mariniluteicoccus flavus]
MKVSEVLSPKGSRVVTIAGDQSVAKLLELLAEHGIGAVVVTGDGASVDGIVSERDVVRRLARDGAATLDGPVADIMTATVHTCGPSDEIESLAELMTRQRIRHVPVVGDDGLEAIVSIGDVVKHRIDRLQDERDQLERYVSQ